MKATGVERVERRRRLVEINLLDGNKGRTRAERARLGCALPFASLLVAIAAELAAYLGLR